MSEQWEVMWWSWSANRGAPIRTPEGWEPVGAMGEGLWLRRRVPTQTYGRGEQQSRLNEYPAQVGLQRALTEEERQQRDKAQQAIALRANQPA